MGTQGIWRFLTSRSTLHKILKLNITVESISRYHVTSKLPAIIASALVTPMRWCTFFGGCRDLPYHHILSVWWQKLLMWYRSNRSRVPFLIPPWLGIEPMRSWTGAQLASLLATAAPITVDYIPTPLIILNLWLGVRVNWCVGDSKDNKDG